MCDAAIPSNIYTNYITVMHRCDPTNLHVWHANSHACVSYRIIMRGVTRFYVKIELMPTLRVDSWCLHVWRASLACVTWLIHICDITYSYMWHYSYICVVWLFHMCDMTHAHLEGPHLWTQQCAFHTLWTQLCPLSAPAVRVCTCINVYKHTKARWTLSLPQISRANPVQCYSTHLEK